MQGQPIDVGMMGGGPSTPADGEIGYQPVSFYDIPGIALGQVLTGNFSGESLLSLLTDPDKLTPHERISLRDQLVSRETNPFGKALIGVVSNPWVWLAMLTSPVGSKALLAGKSLFSRAVGASSQLRESIPFFGKLLTTQELVQGGQSLALQVGASKKAVMVRAVESRARSLDGLLAKFDELHGKRGPWHQMDGSEVLLAHSYEEGSRAREIVEEFTTLNSAIRQNLDRDLEPRFAKTVRVDSYSKEPGGEARKMRRNTPLAGGVRADVADFEVAVTNVRRLEKETKGQFWEEYQDAKDRGVGGTWLKEIEKQGWQGKKVVLPKGVRFGAKEFLDAWMEQHLPKVTATTSVAKGGVIPHVRLLKEGSALRQMEEVFGEAGLEMMREEGLSLQRLFVHLVGDMDEYERTGRAVIQGDKVVRQAANMRRNLVPGGQVSDLLSENTSAQGLEAMATLLGMQKYKEVGEALRRSVVGDTRPLMEAFKELLEPQVWGDPLRWGPRNHFVPVKVLMERGKMGSPSQGLDAMQRAAETWTPLSSSHMASTVVPITEKEWYFNPEALERLKRVRGSRLTAEEEILLDKEIKRGSSAAAYNWRRDGRRVMGVGLDSEAMWQRALDNSSTAIALNVEPATAAMLAEDAEYAVRVAATRRERTSYVGGLGHLKVSEPLPSSPEATRNVTAGDLVERMFHRHAAPYQDIIKNTMVPSMLQKAGPEYMAVYNAQMRGKELANYLAGSRVGSLIEKHGGAVGKRIVERLREVGDFEKPWSKLDLEGGLAKWLYVTHLGMNTSSMLINLLQPLTLAATVGNTDDVLHAYGDAIKGMTKYAELRVRDGGLFINNAKRTAIMREAFPMMGAATGGTDVLGIGPALESIDSWIMQGGLKSGWMDKAASIMMKGFEKTEWMNRLVSAHLYHRVSQRAAGTAMGLERGAYRALGTEALLKHNPAYLTDMERFVLQFQFGANDLNTPLIFQKGFLANPLLRQFMSFPLRMATTAFSVAPRLGGEESYWKGLANVSLRAIGLSAFTYEMGKGLLGADLSKGLYASSVTDIFGGTRLKDSKGEVIQLPPVIDIPVGLLRGVASDDLRLLSDSVARVVPGGVALNRAIGVVSQAPDVVGGFPRSIQKTYVDWNHPLPDGRVPLYKQDGSLIDYKGRAELVAKAFGADLGKFKEHGEFDRYLIKQRDEILKYRQEFLRSLASNDLGKATSIKREFEDRFKVPLTVRQDQMRAFFRNRVSGRTERILGRLPSDLRGQYGGMAPSGAAPNVGGPSSLAGGLSPRMMDAVRQNQMNQEMLQDMIRRAQQVGGAGSRADLGAESPFTGFGGSFQR